MGEKTFSDWFGEPGHTIPTGGADDDVGIPDFLLRAPDGSFLHPDAPVPVTAAVAELAPVETASESWHRRLAEGREKDRIAAAQIKALSGPEQLRELQEERERRKRKIALENRMQGHKQPT